MRSEEQRRSVVTPSELVGWNIDGRYRLGEILGRGGAGIVYSALQQNLNREVAIKLLKEGELSSKSRVDRFAREIDIIARLAHPNIVQVFDTGRDPTLGIRYIAMELVRGNTLAEVMRGHRMRPELAVEIAYEVASALTEPHRLGIVHRDIKPLNVLLATRSDDTLAVKVVDFGIARPAVSDTAVTAEGVMVGSPVYMPPEIVRGEAIDGRADLYSLGIMMYELLTGEAPFRGATPVAIMLRHAADEPVSLSDSLGAAEGVPQLIELVDAMLSKRPDNRPESAKAVMQRLAEIRDAHGFGRIVARHGVLPVEALQPYLTHLDVVPALEHDPDAPTGTISVDGPPLEDPFSGWMVSEAAMRALAGDVPSPRRPAPDTLEIPRPVVLTTTLIGRHKELEHLRSAVSRGESLALVGPSGVGKTTIATHFLETCGHGFASFDAFSRTFDELVESMVTELHIAVGGSTAAKLVLVAEALRHMQVVLIDDVSFDPALLQPLRANFGGVVLLTTHRPPDDFAVLPIAPWEVPTAADFAESDPWHLFETAARRENLAFSLADADVADVHAIVTALAGHPLGIALAGRRAATTSPAVVRELLAEDVRSLRTREGEERHRSLEAALDATWGSLSAPDQHLLYTMVLFRRPVSPSALAEVRESTLADTLDGVARLVRSGVVTPSRFPRPLELFVELARKRFPADSPDAAKKIDDRIHQRAVALAAHLRAEDEPEGALGDAPSFWDYVVDRRGAHLSDPDFAAVLAAWLTWQRLRRAAGAASFEATEVRPLLERVDDWSAWHVAGRTVAPGTSVSAEFFDRALAVADTDVRRQLTQTMRALTFAWRLDLAAASETLELALQGDDRAPLTLWAEGQISLMLGDRARTRRATEALLNDPTTADLPRARTLGIWAYADVGIAEGADALQRSAETLIKLGHLDDACVRLLSLVEYLALEADDLDGALRACEQGRELASKLQSAELVARCRVSAAIAYLHHGRFDEVLDAMRHVRVTQEGHTDENAFIRFVARWQLGEDVSADWPRMRRWADTPRVFWSTLWRVIEIALETDPTRRAEFLRQHRAAEPDAATIFAAINASHSPGALDHPEVRRLLDRDGPTQVGERQAARYLRRFAGE